MKYQLSFNITKRTAQMSIYLLFLLYFPSPRIYFFTQKGEEQKRKTKIKP